MAFRRLQNDHRRGQRQDRPPGREQAGCSAYAVRAVNLRQDRLPLQRFPAAGCDWRRSAEETDDPSRVANTALERHVPGDGGDRQNIEFRRTEREDQRQGVVDPRIGVNDNFAGDRPSYLCTLPEPPLLINWFTSSAVNRLKSPGIECLRHEAATANSSASWCEGRFSSP